MRNKSTGSRGSTTFRLGKPNLDQLDRLTVCPKKQRAPIAADRINPSSVPPVRRCWCPAPPPLCAKLIDWTATASAPALRSRSAVCSVNRPPRRCGGHYSRRLAGYRLVRPLGLRSGQRDEQSGLQIRSRPHHQPGPACLGAFCAGLRAKGVHCPVELKEGVGGSLLCYVAAPDGVSIEIMQC